MIDFPMKVPRHIRKSSPAAPKAMAR